MNTSLHTSMDADSGIGQLARLHRRLYKGCSSWVMCFGPTLTACYDDETQAAAGLIPCSPCLYVTNGLLVRCKL